MAHRLRTKSGRFVKGHGKVRRHKRRNASAPRRRARRRSKRRNPGMPIMLVNPSGGRKRRTRRNPSRRHRRHHRYVRRNPSVSWKSAASAFGLGALGGGVMAGVDYGVTMLPLSAPWQIAAVGVGGGALAIVAAKYGDERVGAGIAGATVLSVVKRGAEAYALSGLAEKSTSTSATSGVQAEGAGAVYRESGALVRARGAQSMAPSGAPRAPQFRDAGAVYRETGASRYVQGPVRLMGPKSWVYGSDAGRVYRSAHNA
jgi:hypothetical protein